MFAKLLKHELKSTGGLLGILCLASLGVGVGGGFIVRYMVQTPAWKVSDAMEAVLSLLFMFMFLSLFAFLLSGWIYLCVQFYKRKFTDQGYLTFTLPAPAWQIYMSSFLNFLLWSFLLGAVMVISLVGIFLIGFVNTEVWEYFVMEVQYIPSEELISDLDLTNPLYSVVEFVSSALMIMNCITFGSVLARKHKILCAIGSYYILSMLMGLASTWLMNMTPIIDPIETLQRMQMTTVLLSGAVGLGGMVLSIWLMSKKLNLP